MLRQRAGLMRPHAPQLDNKERDVVDRLSALLQADEARAARAPSPAAADMHLYARPQLLPPATKLATVAASRAQFAAIREKILGAASMQVADDGIAHDALGAALCAAGVDDDAAAEKAAADEDEERAGMAPAGAADSDREGSAEPGRRTRVRAQRSSSQTMLTLTCRHVC